MSSPSSDFKPIRNLIVQGLLCTFISAIALNIVSAASLNYENPEILVSPPPAVTALSAIFSIVFFYGVIVCWIASCRYARYKGYSWLLGFVAGALNIFGLGFIFILDNKRSSNSAISDNDFDSFNVWSIMVAFVIIPMCLYPLAVVGLAIFTDATWNEAFTFYGNENFVYPISIGMQFAFLWYFYRRFKLSHINFDWLLGKTKVNFVTPLVLAIALFFFAIGINPLTLYVISLISPEAIKMLAVKGVPDTYLGFASFAFLAILVAPIWEELFFRGLLLQKGSYRKNITFGIVVSSFVFAIIHQRYDIIPLFIFGVVCALLYLKTKRLLASVSLHFFYNIIAVSYSFYYYVVAKKEVPVFDDGTRYQEYFKDNLSLSILFVVLSSAYLFYFIYKNYPRHNDINKLPYYVNRARSEQN